MGYRYNNFIFMVAFIDFHQMRISSLHLHTFFDFPRLLVAIVSKEKLLSSPKQSIFGVHMGNPHTSFLPFQFGLSHIMLLFYLYKAKSYE